MVGSREKFKRGDVCLVNLDPVIGSEIAKVRPAVIISNDINNEVANTVTVIPITSKKRAQIYPFEVMLPKGIANLKNDSIAKANQIRTVDKRRILRVLGHLPNFYINQIERAILIHLGIL